MFVSGTFQRNGLRVFHCYRRYIPVRGVNPYRVAIYRYLRGMLALTLISCELQVGHASVLCCVYIPYACVVAILYPLASNTTYRRSFFAIRSRSEYECLALPP